MFWLIHLSLMIIFSCFAEEIQEPKSELTPFQQSTQLTFRSMVEGSDRFAFDFYGILKEGRGNICFSPYSITFGLAMAASGAGGQTAQEFQQVLHYSLSFLTAAKDLDNQFFNIPSGHTRSTQLLMADALWINQHLPLTPSFGKIFEKNFNMNLQLMDFLYNKGSAVRKINQWTSKQTNNKIREILSLKDVDVRTQLLVTTAMTMKGKWMHPFDNRKTAFLPFYVTNRSILVDMMETVDHFQFWEGKKMALLVVPYATNQENEQFRLAMVFLVPGKDVSLQMLENELSWENWESWKKNLKPEELKIVLPRFRVEEHFELKSALNQLGLSEAFLPNANFSGMSEEKDIHLFNVFHKALIRIDEGGTDSGGGIVRSLPEEREIKKFTVDRPFIYIIFDENTGTIFFMGRIEHP